MRVGDAHPAALVADGGLVVEGSGGFAGGERQCGRRGALRRGRRVVFLEPQDGRVILGAALGSSGMAFDHTLGSEEGLDLVARLGNIAALLHQAVRQRRVDATKHLRATILDALRQNQDIGGGGGHRSRSGRPGSAARHISGCR